MQNKNILFIILANLLWSLIPVIVYRLFDEISIITIIFLRFFSSAIILLVIAFLLLFLNNRNPSNARIEIKDLFNFVIAKNKRFFNFKNIEYFMIMGSIGIILQVVFYFLALKFTSISITMIGTFVAIILIAFYEHGNKSEKLDIFKMLYLLMLIFSITIIIIVKTGQTGFRFTFNGIIYILLYIMCLTFFQISIDRDVLTKEEIKLINKNNNYKIIRLLFKLSLTFLLGIGIMLPILLLVNLFPWKSDLSLEINQFIFELSDISNIFLRWEIIFLIIFSTISPYLLIFFANVKWKPYHLTYRQWNSILSVIDPIGSIFFGVVFGIEIFPALYLAIVLFLLVISVFFRYVHESSNVINCFILINHKKGDINQLSLKLLKFDGVYSLQHLIGTYDMLLNIKSNSIRNLYYLINEEIRKLEQVKSLEILFINKINKFSIS